MKIASRKMGFLFAVLLIVLFFGSSALTVESDIQVSTTLSDSAVSIQDGPEVIVIPVKKIEIGTENIDQLSNPVEVEYTITHEGTGKTETITRRYEADSGSKINATETLRVDKFSASSYPVSSVTSLTINVKANHPELDSAVDTKQIRVIRQVDNTNCNTIKQTDPSAESGVHTINPSGASNEFEVYCDMDTDGGGWTLVMKSSGSDDSFRYNSNYWTSNSNTLNADSVNLDTTVPTKLNSYNTVKGDEIRAEFPDHQNHQMVEPLDSNRTPYSIFTTTDEKDFEEDGSGTPTCGTNEGIGRFGDYWYNFDGETNDNNADTIFAHQCGRQQYGFDISTGYDAFTGTKVRWGWNWQNEADSWESQDAVAGIGLVKDATGGTREGELYSTTVGSQVFCCSNKASARDDGAGEHPRDVLIWIR